MMAKRHDDTGSDPHAALAQSLARRFEATAGYKNVLDERGNALMAVNERSGPRSKSYASIESKLKKDDQQLERIKMAVRRPISRWGVRTWILALVAVVLAIFEAPANKFLFDNALQSFGFASMAASFATTAFLLLLAHFAGRSIRQIWSDYRHKIIWSNVLIFLGCVAFAGAMVSVLTVARSTFASTASTVGDLISGIQTITTLGPAAITQALTDPAAIVLAMLNLGAFGATFVLAFFSHDSDRDFDHAQNAVDKGEARLEKVHERYLAERAKLVKGLAPDLIGFAANYNTANSRIIELKTRLQMSLDDDDRFVLTDLDQMSEDAERQEQIGPDETPPPAIPAAQRVEPSIASMSDYRRQTGTDSA
jgi:hypothetical protein